MSESSDVNSVLLRAIADTEALREIQVVALERSVNHRNHLICDGFKQGIDEDALAKAADLSVEEVRQICDRGLRNMPLIEKQKQAFADPSLPYAEMWAEFERQILLKDPALKRAKACIPLDDWDTMTEPFQRSYLVTYEAED